MRKAKYIVFEGTERVGKTTQVNKLYTHLTSQGYKVLLTKEPGTNHLPITLDLRKIVLDNKYDKDLTPISREFLNQAIRSIHIDKLILPALHEYDFIIQDRGVLSGLSYGVACGNKLPIIMDLLLMSLGNTKLYDLYDQVIVLKRDVQLGLNEAQAKKEFETGDTMESKGVEFLKLVETNMDNYRKYFKNTTEIKVEGIEETFNKILEVVKETLD